LTGLAHRRVPFNITELVIDRGAGLNFPHTAAHNGHIIMPVQESFSGNKPSVHHHAVAIDKLHMLQASPQFIQAVESGVSGARGGKRGRHIKGNNLGPEIFGLLDTVVQ
jgi:hypothetical protein